ncbi:MAG TPA: AbrB/MazE/SpoVT family DNA-binding domain-containing protein [Caulobacteraceae bacterium]|jgi:antitoxin MazE|nr:AbrB/MazE/SpoVT family DNA-binding domain-containing protein [Caulobacteraceae bacterium]
MTVARVGKWGASLAVRIPAEVAEAVGLGAGEDVDLDIRDGDIVVRRSKARLTARAEALKAMAEMLAERETHTLRGLNIQDLKDEGRG